MKRFYFYMIILLVLACAILILTSMWQNTFEASPAKEQIVLHPVSPFKSYISGSGIVEAGSKNIFISTPLRRVVEKVQVTAGQEVKKEDVLIRLDDRDLEADLNGQQVAYQIALAKFQKLKALPRAEDLDLAQANVKNAEVELENARNQYERVQRLQDSRAISQEERSRRLFNYQKAEAQMLQAKANQDKTKSGTSEHDLKIAWLEVMQAKAKIKRLKTDIQQTIIRSPIEGKILQIKIHEGEYPPLDPKSPMIVVGNTDEKHLKVSINQFNASRFRPEAAAVAFLQGDAQTEFPLEFVQLEPYLINKQNITNDIREKVDTRVLQVTYRFKKLDQNIFVGQQMDVFIDAEYPK